MLRGCSDVTAHGTRYYKFLGIPYAKPPVGRLRFLAPMPPIRWSGVRNASDFGSQCYQSTPTDELIGDEDCLFINVFTPQLPFRHTDLLPVMVWIHGGAFVYGSGNLNPGQLMDRGIVLVTCNYRLNVLGFLSIKDTDATGNAGLKDQSAVLRWVRRNIVHFGGDPHKVTIFGVSAGGALVHYHMLSPMSKGLFHRAISQSGTALMPVAFNCHTDDHAYRLSYLVGRGANNSQDLVANLRATPVKDLFKAIPKILNMESNDGFVRLPFTPTMDYRRPGEEPFLLQSPECLEYSGSFHKVPFIIGINLYEARFFYSEKLLSQPSYWRSINKDLEQIVPVNLGLEKGSWVSKEVARKIKEFYCGKDVSYENRDCWLNLQSDLNIVLGSQATLLSHAKYSDMIKTYNYHFVYNNATHTDECQYIFYEGNLRNQSSSDTLVAEYMGSLWASFAKTSVPTAENGFLWPPVSVKKFPYLHIDKILSLGKNLRNDQINFWASIYRDYRLSGSCCR